MNATSPSILIVGAGAIGAVFGSALARQGAQVSVVCRSDFDHVARHGYNIRSGLLGDHTFRPHAVLREVAQCTEPPEYLILTVKVLQDVDRAALIRPAVGQHTVIVLIENGIDIEAEIAGAFPANELLSALAFIGVGRTSAGDIHHQLYGSLTMGRYPSGITPAAERLAELFDGARIGMKLTDNVVGARWQKALWNTVFNPISILGGVLDTQAMLRTEADREFIRKAMLEVNAVATVVGCPSPPQLIDQLIAGTCAMPAYKTSMALDFEAQRPMEIEAIIGNVVRTGRTHAVAMPALEAIYALAKMVAGKVTG
ncbi:MAG TPA: 2-dehydropantoate 2-reductase [Povalibacter sp.]